MSMRTTALAIATAVVLTAPTVAQKATPDPSQPGPKPVEPTAPHAQPDRERTRPTLGVGDPAPPLAVKEWVKGTAVQQFEEGRVYVVEFWATWCGPCRASIPHLTSLQKKHRDLTVIGVSVWESDFSNVRPFVDKQGENMAYTVAIDDVPPPPKDASAGQRRSWAVNEGRMSRMWMKAAGRTGIPTAFVVGKDGRIGWIGHPLRGLDEAVEQALAAPAPRSRAHGSPPPAAVIPVAYQPQPPPKPGPQETPPAPAGEEIRPLFVGDKAPRLTVEHWVKGEPVTAFEKGKVYVVEFWATWCGPCIASIPHTTEIQKKYEKDVVVIGVAASEMGRDDQGKELPPAERLANLTRFVERQGDEMGYRVAFDADRSMSRTWMEAAEQHGIPCTFIVDRDGRIAWIGHPMVMDEPLAQIVAGTWDLAAAAAEFRRELDASRQAQAAFEVVETFRALLMEDPDRAYASVRDQVQGVLWNNAEALNAVAWSIVDPDNEPATKDLDLALKAAARAVELTQEKDAAILDTLAKVHFDRGDLRKAVDLQRKAVDLVERMARGPMRTQLERELKDRLRQFEEALRKKGG